MKTIYKSPVTIYDKNSKHTLVEGEECKINKITYDNNICYVHLTNTQNNELILPLDIFNKIFKK